MHTADLIRREGVENAEPFSAMLPTLEHCFGQLSVKRQSHLDAVTRLGHGFIQLRRREEPNYPNAATGPEAERSTLRLLLAWNLHDFGDIPVKIPVEFIHTEATARRREEIKRGDWISSAPYDDEKFDAPIRGWLIHQAIRAALDADAPLTAPSDAIITQLGLPATLRRKLSALEREQLDWNALVAYQHHEYFDGKGWPRGVKLDPNDPLMDVTFADFQSGWYADKMSRGDKARPISATLPADVFAAMEVRQIESLARNPAGAPMYHRGWLALVKAYPTEVDALIDGIFPDVRRRREKPPALPAKAG